MSSYFWAFIAMLSIVFVIMQRRKQKIAAILNHRKNHKHKENTKMKELAQKFIDKDCLIYIITGETAIIKGVIKDVTDCGLLVESDGNLQAVNLEYITRIREYPKKKNGKKKSIIVD